MNTVIKMWKMQKKITYSVVTWSSTTCSLGMHQPEEPQQLGSEIFNMYLNITFSPAMILFCECLEGLKSVNTGSQKHITKTNPYPQSGKVLPQQLGFEVFFEFNLFLALISYNKFPLTNYHPMSIVCKIWTHYIT